MHLMYWRLTNTEININNVISEEVDRLGDAAGTCISMYVSDEYRALSTYNTVSWVYVF